MDEEKDQGNLILSSIATTSLYYPFIEIPEQTLVHALLFKDRIKRIIPPRHAVEDYMLDAFNRPNKISKQILGYEFIEEADYSDSRHDIAEAFVNLLIDAHDAANPREFEPLFGKNYQVYFDLKKWTKVGRVQHFIYAHKFDQIVFEKLRELGWMRGEEICELRKRLCNVYMTLLAAAISKRKKEPISTGLKESEEILRNPIFKKYFALYLPPQLQENNQLQELCLALLLSGSPKRLSDTKSPAIHEVINFREAVYIRASLESHRKDFCQAVDSMVGKIIAIGPRDPKALATYEAKALVDSARAYKDNIDREIQRQVSNSKKEFISRLRTGISLSFPVLGTIADTLFQGSPTMSLYTALGTTISLASFLLFQRAPKSADGVVQQDQDQRQNAYLFLNQLWNLQDNLPMNIMRGVEQGG